MAITLAVLAVARIWAWWRYLNALESEGAPTRTLEIFTACRMWYFTAGLVLPLALVAAGLIVPVAAAILFALAGLSVFATGWAIKFLLITCAGFNQGFALPHTPVRGTGALDRPSSRGGLCHEHPKGRSGPNIKIRPGDSRHEHAERIARTLTFMFDRGAERMPRDALAALQTVAAEADA